MDTSFLIDVLQRRPSAVALFGHLLETHQRAFVAAAVVQELYLGAGLAKDAPAERRRIEQLLAGLPTLAFDNATAKTAGLLEARRMNAGRKPGRIDLQIATTALAHGYSLVSRDRGIDIDGLDLITY